MASSEWPAVHKSVRSSFARSLLYLARLGAISYRRGHPLRSACVLIVKRAARQKSLLVGLNEIRPLDRPDICFGAADSIVLETIYWAGVQGYEGILAALWSALCAKASSVLEIGGNVGLYSVLGASAARGTYTVVEPIPHIAKMLRENLERNQLERVELLEAAVIPDRRRKTVTLNLPDENRAIQTGAHLVDDVEIASRQTLRRIDVLGIPFSELVRGRDLIKIDAEGLEHALLRSCEAEIIQARPTIVVEVLPESVKLAELIKNLANAAGYRLFVPPAYGSDEIREVPSIEFSAITPLAFKAKDVVLSTTDVRVAGRREN